MRKEQFCPGTFVHVVNRGAHRMNIVRTDADRWRFLKLLRYLNDTNAPRNWERDISPTHIRNNFAQPEHWGEAQPYVSILSYCLKDNHFHLLLLEQIEGGVSKFMQRISRSMAANFNVKYESSGALFQGPYRARIVDDDRHLQYLSVYINIKNVFEAYPGGLKAAFNNFDDAYAWAVQYPFSSTADFAGERKSSLIDHMVCQSLFATPSDFKTAAKELMEVQFDTEDSVFGLTLDE
ncbi:MAG: transposase [bacterium]|nr:transposase [bacterium]